MQILESLYFFMCFNKDNIILNICVLKQYFIAQRKNKLTNLTHLHEICGKGMPHINTSFFIYQIFSNY